MTKMSRKPIKRPKPGKVSAQHSAETCEWGTADDMRKHALHTLQRIDMDPSSSPEWNRAIGAHDIITEREDFRLTPWVPGGPSPARVKSEGNRMRETGWDFRVQINPPGDPDGELVSAAWNTLIDYYLAGWVTAAVWIGFSVEQLAKLQRIALQRLNALHFPTLIMAKRPRFLSAPNVPGKSPSHAGFLTLLGGDDAMLRRFADTNLGTVVVPLRPFL